MDYALKFDGSMTPEAWLRETFQRRRLKNSRYSLRAFARDVGLSPALVCLVFEKKRRLTERSALRLAQTLCMDPTSKLGLTASVTGLRGHKEKAKLKVRATQMDMETFELIASWEHYAILSLARTKGARADGEWVALRLGISKKHANAALSRLKKLGFVRVVGNRFTFAAKNLDSPHDVPSAAIQRHHISQLRNAENALASATVEERYFGATTMAFRVADMPAAKTMLRRFRDRFQRRFSNAEADEVYTITTNFFPISQKERES